MEEITLNEKEEIALDQVWEKIKNDLINHKIGANFSDSIHDQIAAAAAIVDHEPSEAAKKAGNYSKGHFELQGLPITLENAKGGFRRGVSKDGTPWETEMKSHYGYIKGTKSDADGDHIDCFIGDTPESEKVFIVDQVNPDGDFDEHKCLIGFTDMDAARQGYLDCYSPGWTGLGGITEMTMNQFKDWIDSGDTGNPISDLKKQAVTASTFSSVLDNVDAAFSS